MIATRSGHHESVCSDQLLVHVSLQPNIMLDLQGRRVAQAQAQQQAEITFTESLEVVSMTPS